MFSLTNSTPSSSYSSFSLLSPKGENNLHNFDVPHDDPDAHIESDIADQYDSVDLSSRFSIPPRPTSRLGFHDSGAMDSPTPSETPVSNSKPFASHSRSRSATLRWTRSLFQKMGLTSGPPTEVETDVADSMEKFVPSGRNSDIDDDDTEPTTLSVLPSSQSLLSSSSSSSLLELGGEHLMLDDVNFTFGSSDEESDSSDCGESDIDLDSLTDIEHASPVPYPMPPCSFSPSITAPVNNSPLPSLNCTSILSPPQLPSPSISPELEDAEPLPRSKYSCLPSPFSPLSKPTSDPQHQPQRHDYEHRGYSRHSLLHLKWFWALREEEWAEYAAANEANVYGGIKTSPELPDPHRFPSLFSSARTTVPNSRRSRSQPQSPPSSPDLSLMKMPPMTVHPRWGDFCSLRDSWCVHMDRYFVGMPLWTIRKALWMFDVHVMMEAAGQSADTPSDETGGPCSSQVSLGTTEGDVDDDDDNSDLHSESLEMSMLGGLSDDSDVTLVESESDNEALSGCESGSRNANDVMGTATRLPDKQLFDMEAEEEFFEDVDLNSPETGCSSSSSSSSSSFRSFSSSSHYSATTSPQKSISLDHPHSPTLSPPRPSFSRYSFKGSSKKASSKKRLVPWETSWYKRSEFLLQLTRSDREEERERYEEEERRRLQRAHCSGLNPDSKDQERLPDGSMSSSTSMARGLGFASVDDSFATKDHNEKDLSSPALVSRSRTVSI